MTTVPDIPVVQLPALGADDVADIGARSPSANIWAVDVPHGRRMTPVVLAALGVTAGIAAMALGVAAVVFAGSSSPQTPSPATSASRTASARATAALPAVERRALALLAKPSTERITFRGARGLVLAVGSGGRAAVLIRGLAPTRVGTPYNAWIIAPRGAGAPVRAARFGATDRAVFLGTRLGPRASVVVSTARPVAGPPARNRVVALRG